MTTPRTILVAEDEDGDFFLLEKAFSQHKEIISLVRVRDGIEAIDYLTGTKGFEDRSKFPVPDLLLLDLNMPRRNGLEVVEWLRQRSDCKDLVTVILSSSQRETDVNKAYALGANAYLKKPSDYSDFLEMARVLVSYWFRWAGRPRPNVSPDIRLRQETPTLA